MHEYVVISVIFMSMVAVSVASCSIKLLRDLARKRYDRRQRNRLRSLSFKLKRCHECGPCRLIAANGPGIAMPSRTHSGKS